MARVFFALELPDDLRRQIAFLQQEIPVKPGEVKWVEKNNLHITLYFAGEVDTSRLQQLLKRAEDTATHLKPFTAVIKGIGAFPALSRPQVLWLGIEEGRTEITSMAKMLTETKDRSKKPFVPHLTMGRVRAGKKVDLKQFLQQAGDYKAGSFLVTKFCCFQSKLTPQGPIYTKIKEFFLQ